MILTLANRKGGTGKSTAAVFLAGLLAQDGRTLIVDADPQGSILSWSEAAGYDFPAAVVQWPTRDLARRVAQVAADYSHIVIDTGRAPGDDDPVLRQAMMAADTVLIPVAPSLMEVRELGRVLDMVDELQPLHPLRVHVMLTRVRAGTTSAREAREGLGHLPLVQAQIGQREVYAQAWGTVIRDFGEFRYVLEELQAGVTV